MTFHKKYADKDFQTEVKEDNFQDLKQYYGLSFDRDSTLGLTCNDPNSIIGWDDNTMAHSMKKMKFTISHDCESIRIC